MPGFEDGPRPLLTFILRALDGQHKDLVAEHLRFHFGNKLHRINPQERALFVNAIKSNSDLFYVAVDSFCDTLQRMSDMWIASGKAASDRTVDTVADRNVEDVLPDYEGPLFEWIEQLLFVRSPQYLGMRRDGSIGLKEAFPDLDTTPLFFQFREWETVLRACFINRFCLKVETFA
jgi:hypothetical protein